MTVLRNTARHSVKSNLKCFCAIFNKNVTGLTISAALTLYTEKRDNGVTDSQFSNFRQSHLEPFHSQYNSNKMTQEVRGHAVLLNDGYCCDVSQVPFYSLLLRGSKRPSRKRYHTQHILFLVTDSVLARASVED